MGTVSGHTVMKFAPPSVILWALTHWVTAQDEIICPPGVSTNSLTIAADGYVDYYTQDGAPTTQYTNNVQCAVLFKKAQGADCQLQFNCTDFDLKSRKPAPRCQDKIIIKKKKYCQMKGPDVTVGANKLKVVFKTNKKGVASGAVCRAYCVPPPPPPGYYVYTMYKPCIHYVYTIYILCIH